MLNPYVLSTPKIQSYLTYRLNQHGVQVNTESGALKGTDFSWMCIP